MSNMGKQQQDLVSPLQPLPQLERQQTASTLGDLNEKRSISDVSDEVVIKPKSYGVVKAEAAAKWMSTKYIWMVFIFIAIAAYWIALLQYLEGTFETEALSVSFGTHSLIATINTATAIMQSVSQVPYSKACDLFGRFETYLVSLVLYILGLIIVSTSQNIGTYAAGNLLQILGMSGFWLVTQVIIADNSSTRSRLFWSIFPSILGVANIWVSGEFATAIIPATGEGLGWRFGFSLFTWIVPICLAPAICALAWAQRRAGQAGHLEGVVAPWKGGNVKKISREIYWQTDILGIFLMAIAYALILIPITLANNGTHSWDSAEIPTMIAVGVVMFGVFCFYEWKYARHPILPFRLFNNRTIIFGFLLALVHPMAGSIQGNYLFTWFRVANNQTIGDATTLSNLGYLGTIASALTGLAVIKIPYLKPFIVSGGIVQTLALALMTRYRGRSNSYAEIAILQVLKGCAAGMISFPVQAAVQSAVKHENLALITGAWLSLYYLAGGIGSAIGGAIWSAELPGRLLAATGGDQAMATSIYTDPITWISENGFDNPMRERVAIAYSDSQKNILITSACVSALVIIFGLCLENIKLGKGVTVEKYEDEGKVVRPGQAAKDAEKDRFGA